MKRLVLLIIVLFISLSCFYSGEKGTTKVKMNNYNEKGEVVSETVLYTNGNIVSSGNEVK